MNIEVENIKKFLRPPDRGGAYTDQRLADLQAHAESGKLSFYSCCCLQGVPSAPHKLAVSGEYDPDHCHKLYWNQLAIDADREFFLFGLDEGGGSDSLRRERLLPLIAEEWRHREFEGFLREYVGMTEDEIEVGL